MASRSFLRSNTSVWAASTGEVWEVSRVRVYRAPILALANALPIVTLILGSFIVLQQGQKLPGSGCCAGRLPLHG